VSIEYAVIQMIGTGTAAGARIHPLLAPIDVASPYLVYGRRSTRRDQTFDGDGGVAEAVVRLTCWATTYVAAVALAKSIRPLIVKGDVLANGGTYEVYEASVIDEGDSLDAGDGEEQSLRYGRWIDCRLVWCEETEPA